MKERTPIRVLFVEDLPFVEDSKVDVELSLRALEQDGFEVSRKCVVGEAPLKHALSSWRPQAIVADFSEPGFCGMDALRLARETTPAIPLIFVSGRGEERANEAIRLGAADVVRRGNLWRLGPSVRSALPGLAGHGRARIPMRVLFVEDQAFVEDSKVDVEMALRVLNQNGFEVTRNCVMGEEQLKQTLISWMPQAILADFSVPEFCGMDALRVAKEMAPAVPFFFVSGEARAIEAIRIGATDSVLKDNLRRLGPAVRRALSGVLELGRARTPIRVLFVEDSEIDVGLIVGALKQDGFDPSCERVELEESLKQALSLRRPEVILSDFSMPGFFGMDALRLAREVAPEVPFIFISGTIGEERAIEAIRLGATDCVLKDDLRWLGTAVRRALSEAAERGRARAAEEERARLVEILEATSDFVSMSDPAGTTTYLNAAGCRLVGLDESAGAGAQLSRIHPPWARKLIEREGRPAAALTGSWQGETAIKGADGTEIPVSQVIVAHRGKEGEIRFYSTIARDIRERKAYEAGLQYLAHHDALTGLPNRALLGDRALQAIATSRRSGRPTALLVLDLDRFKLVNEGYGRAAGDALLCVVAERLRGAVREGDTVARLGADEFGVLATDLARPEDVLAVVRKIQDSMRSPFLFERRELHLAASIGASAFPRDGEEFDVLLSNADAAMQRVKAEGRNGFQFYLRAMTRQANDRLELENDLRLALERGDMELYYQPQVAFADGRIVGVEALMRWQHHGRGSISPLQFVPIAEESELIHPLGEFALAQSCRQAAIWERAGYGPLRIAVNVSARQFRNPGFVQTVERALRAAELEPGRLDLELTEGVLVEKREEAIAILQRLKALGVKIAVDDFGTGYSSLSYLSRLPLDCLKIDRSFVNRVHENGHDAAIAQTVISLAHSLGLRVVAEGVETLEQMGFLKAHGCNQGQGHLYSTAVRADAMANLLAYGSLNADARATAKAH